MRLSFTDKVLFLATVIILTLAAAVVHLIALRRIARYLGTSLGPVGFVPLASPNAHLRALRLRDSIGRATTILPFRRDCYPQALAGVLLCHVLNVPVAMHLGVKLRENGAMEAHAWLSSGRVCITGRAGASGFTPVACFFSA
jgi:Transglutaminase-like superfamily